YEVSGLVLESPYTSLPDVGADRYPLVPVHVLIRDKFESVKKIRNVHLPLLILHGELDQIVPAKFGRQLYAAANDPKQAEFVPDAGHNDVYNLRVQQIVLNYLGKLPTEGLFQMPARETGDTR
ncbi:MAG: alpha/beta hydrolase, partial [Bdellovibrionales bacterium]